MDNSVTTKSDRLEELELFEYRERLTLKMGLEYKRNFLITDINHLLKQDILKNDVIAPIEHTSAFTLSTVKNIEGLRRLVSSLKEKRTELKDEYKRRLFSDVVVEISYEDEINRLITVKNDQIRKKLKNREIIDELYERRGDLFKTLLDCRNELVTKINDNLRHTGLDDENDIYMERYSSTVTNFSLENFDNLRKCISRLQRKLTDLEYNGIKTNIFV